jgi:hypothetical protein
VDIKSDRMMPTSKLYPLFVARSEVLRQHMLHVMSTNYMEGTRMPILISVCSFF